MATCPKCGSSEKITKIKLQQNNQPKLSAIEVEMKIENANCEFKCHNCGYEWKDTCGFLDSLRVLFN